MLNRIQMFPSETDALPDSKLSQFVLHHFSFRDLAVLLRCDIVDEISLSFQFMRI